MTRIPAITSACRGGALRQRFIIPAFALTAASLFAGIAGAREEPAFWGEQRVRTESHDASSDWFRDAKYAMFIHWGLYAEPAGIWKGENYFGISEWIMHRARIPVAEYEQLAARFNPTAFDADRIAQLAVDAGMKYIVFTAKHHDGFAMYDSAVSPYNIVDATPFGRDVLKELAEACRRHGLKFGIYYSQSQDWHERHAYGNDWDFSEQGRDFQQYLHAKALPQIRELLTGYGDLGLIFFDTPAGITREQVVALRAGVAELQPNCLVNSRIGQGLGDYVTLGDSEFPNSIRDGLWESIDTHNKSWGYSKLDIDWKDASQVIERLVRVVCKGGNFMLNVGPKADGSVPAEAAAILQQVGTWVRANAEAIYGTRAVPMGDQGWIEATGRPGKVYLFIRDWPDAGRLWLPLRSGTIDRARILGTNQLVPLRTQGNHAYLEIPRVAPDTRCSVIVLEHASPLEFEDSKWVVPHSSTALFPFEAERQGVSFAPGLRWMEVFGDWRHQEVLEKWKPGAPGVEWAFHCPQAGAYYVDIEYAGGDEADLKEGILELGGKRHPFVTVSTGGSRVSEGARREIPRFMTRRIGMVHLEAGRHVLRLQRNFAGSDDWIRLSRVSIVPTE